MKYKSNEFPSDIHFLDNEKDQVKGLSNEEKEEISRKDASLKIQNNNIKVPKLNL